MSLTIGRRARIRCCIGILAAAALVTGCGIQPQSEPQPLSSADLERAGVATPGVTTPPPSPTATATTEATIFLVRGQRLVAVKRTIDLTESTGPTVSALLAGPTKDEAKIGITSAIPPGITGLDVTVVDGVGVVGVPSQFESLGGTNQILAIAQLVFTLTGISGISGLQLTDGGSLVDVPNAAGELSYGPVYRADFAAVAPSGLTLAPTPSPS